ncbi:MAG: ferrochelatase [Ilumatobacteraceae bacterium]
MSKASTTSERQTSAVLLMSYGTPRDRLEILPYYTDIRRGRAPTTEQLAELTARYNAIGGVSPLVARSEAQRDALVRELEMIAPGEFHVQLGFKHSRPTIEETVTDLARNGFRRIIALVLAPHFSEYSVGQYISRAKKSAESLGVTVTGIKSWAIEPAFINFVSTDLNKKLTAMAETSSHPHVLFTAHSLPQRIIDSGDPYPSELRSTASAISKLLNLSEGSQWTIAWQSAGRTPEPWVGPDILTVIDQLAAGGECDGVVVSGCGFVSDHLEVLYDIDIEARQRAEQHGLSFARTDCVNDDPAVMSALAHRVVAAQST